METFLETNSQLHLLGYTLEPFQKDDEADFYAIYREVVDSASQFPYECNSLQEFHRQFFSGNSQVFVCKSLESQKVIGGFYLRANYTGRCKHIANAAYMINKSYRGKGVGTLLIKASMALARELEFQAMQFNMVLSENKLAIKLYQKLGFSIVGTIPQAILNPDNSYQDGYVMYRYLN
jgi:L-amino acid N-acyltransferase YncA